MGRLDHDQECALTLQGFRTVGALIPFTPDVVLIVQQPARAV